MGCLRNTSDWCPYNVGASVHNLCFQLSWNDDTDYKNNASNSAHRATLAEREAKFECVLHILGRGRVARK